MSEDRKSESLLKKSQEEHLKFFQVPHHCIWRRGPERWMPLLVWLRIVPTCWRQTPTGGRLFTTPPSTTRRLSCAALCAATRRCSSFKLKTSELLGVSVSGDAVPISGSGMFCTTGGSMFSVFLSGKSCCPTTFFNQLKQQKVPGERYFVESCRCLARQAQIDATASGGELGRAGGCACSS